MSNPNFTFWSDINCTQSDIGSVPADQSGAWELKASGTPVQNDEARSCTIKHVSAGVVLEDVASMCIGTFEQNIDSPSVSMTYHPKNGLDSKVSFIKVSIENRERSARREPSHRGPGTGPTASCGE